MNDISEITQKLITFRDERDWKQFHDARNLALAISLEAAELNELFLWKKDDQISDVDESKIKEELADIFAFALLLAEKYNFDVKEIVLEKIKKNSEKYPVHKSKGSSLKYDQL